MNKFLSNKLFAAVSVAVILSACASSPKQVDYTAFRNSKPQSILVLPPVSQSTDTKATYGMLAQMTKPLAEAGYYVVPVAEMAETFKHNGLTTASDIQNVAPKKLREIFGADAALYTTVTSYGTSYRVIASSTIVAADAKLVDLRSGEALWSGHASADGNEVGFNAGNGSGLIGALITQVAHSAGDKSYDVAGLTSHRLLSAGGKATLLYGPRSPKYGTD